MENQIGNLFGVVYSQRSPMQAMQNVIVNASRVSWLAVIEVSQYKFAVPLSVHLLSHPMQSYVEITLPQQTLVHPLSLCHMRSTRC